MKINREHVLEAVRQSPGTLTKRALARALGLSGDARRQMRILLQELTQDGTLIRTDKRTYTMAGTLPDVMVVRIDHIDTHGDLIGFPARWDGKGKGPKILVFEPKHKNKSGATLGIKDRALCKIRKKNGEYQAEILKKLGASPRTELGVVVKGKRGWLIRPVRKGSRYDHVPKPESQLVDQELVLFELTNARHKGSRIARIVESLGRADGPRAASLISLYEHNIPIGFSKDEITQAKAGKLPKLDEYRKDLRHLPVLTIDPVDAKDFDDAIFAQPDESPKNKGGHIVWVAIADVSAYVLPGSALDKGAFKRGNSVYLPDRVEPMLPEELSADMCSLRPNEDRACLAVRMVFGSDGTKKSHKFTRGLMRSKARLSYANAQSAFMGKPDSAAMPVKDILADIFAAYKTLQQARNRRAPLEIEMPERRVKLDNKSQVISIAVCERYDAHKLVEEFMIQANVCAAQALDAKNAHMIFRVHESPEHEKLQGLADFLPAINMKWSLGERPTPKRFNRLLDSARKNDLEETVSMAILRTQMKAYYTPKNAGHFGLNLNHYTHFTSPIRRYADLIVHRALIRTFGLGEDGGEDGASDKELLRLKEISEHISKTERQAMAAERDAKDRYVATFLQDKLGAQFSGRITGVTRAGLFIMLDETGADGFAPARNLGLERFFFNEKSKSLIGSDTGGTYKFGQRVNIKLLEATPVQGGLIFDVLTKPLKGKPYKGRGAQSSHRGKHKGGYKKRGNQNKQARTSQH
ncbi:MAG: ribonuclease R [Robiginitomaculum sp.]